MNNFQENMPDTAERRSAERHIEALRQQGGMFVEAVRVTRMPMLVTDATLPGNPILFANKAFTSLSGYTLEELLGQDPHFMNGEQTDPDAIRRYQEAMQNREDATLEILQYRKDGSPFHAMLFASPLDNGQGGVTNHFLSYLDVSRRIDAEKDLRAMAAELEQRVTDRTLELEAANERLTKLLSERDMLMMEVNHRAKNSLAIAASLLAIQERRQTDRAVKVLFKEAQDRLNAMARVHDLLSKSESAQRVDLATYVTDLCEALRPITENDHCIAFSTQADEGILVEAGVAFSLGIVLTELITNAVKYAFPGAATGTILAQVRRHAPGRIAVLIRDDGIGISHLREGSLGYGLVRSLVQQIGGEMDIRNDGGLAVTISFPDTSRPPAADGAKRATSDQRTRPELSKPLMANTRTLYSSPNGDRWQLVSEGGQILVEHRPNEASGGQTSRIAVGAFLARDGGGPEYHELTRLMSGLVANG